MVHNNRIGSTHKYNLNNVVKKTIEKGDGVVGVPKEGTPIKADIEVRFSDGRQLYREEGKEFIFGEMLGVKAGAP